MATGQHGKIRQSEDALLQDIVAAAEIDPSLAGRYAKTHRRQRLVAGHFNGHKRGTVHAGKGFKYATFVDNRDSYAYADLLGVGDSGLDKSGRRGKR